MIIASDIIKRYLSIDVVAYKPQYKHLCLPIHETNECLKTEI